MLRLYRSSFHNVHRTFLHVNPTHPFTNDLENCTWTKQVTLPPRVYCIRLWLGEVESSVVMQRCGLGKIQLVSLDLPPLSYQVSPINSLHLFREKYVCGSYWRVSRYWRCRNYLPALTTGGLSIAVCLNLFNNSCLISTSCDKSLHLTAFITEILLRHFLWNCSINIKNLKKK